MNECKSESKIAEVKMREWKRKLNRKEIHPRNENKNENDAWANEKKKKKRKEDRMIMKKLRMKNYELWRNLKVEINEEYKTK